jgi:hypothetical protein
MAKPFFDYPVLQIRPRMMLVYTRREWLTNKRREETPEAEAKKAQTLAAAKERLIRARTYSGLVTPDSEKKIKRVINILLAIAKPKTVLNPKTNKWYSFKINFVTLTLPSAQGSIPDKEIKKQVFDVWLKSARRTVGLKSYFWRAEKQENGNVHFVFIPHQKLRDSWNNRLERLGFVTAFEEKHKHRIPNSTDVHAVYNIKNLPAYLAKYCSKGKATPADAIAQPPWSKPRQKFKPNKRAKAYTRLMTLDEQRIDGKIWDCSKNLKQKGNCEMMLEGTAEQLWNDEALKRQQDLKPTAKCTMLFHTPEQLEKMLFGEPLKTYTDWLKTFDFKDEDPKAKPDTPADINTLQSCPF